MKIINKPDIIYLQCGDDFIEEDAEVLDFKKDLDEVTWCSDSVFTTDIPYYSKDVLLEFADYCFEQYSEQDKSFEELFNFWIYEKTKKK